LIRPTTSQRAIESSKPANTYIQYAPAPDPPSPAAHYYMNEDKDENKNMLMKRERPYLILDIRDVDDYKRGRIVTSKSYPAAMLSRSVNKIDWDPWRVL
jgi:hypothetical protein